MNTARSATRPTTRLFALHCEQYRRARDRWSCATEVRDFYAVCIAKDAIEGREVDAEHAYAFQLFDRLDALHLTAHRSAACLTT
jgi:hypothetical protein